ncbi:MAG: hypothetical protein BGO31_20100 [Bacteroidetes bacterium 43-16]|nr:MAG: hypothetical protein BGO31_20100 [Bacteroidetes bacterium 43-16]
MAKTIHRKYGSFKSLQSLEDAQDRVKREYRDIEDNAISNIFDPVKIGMDLVPSVFSFFTSRKNKRKKTKPSPLSGLSLYPANPLQPINPSDPGINGKKKGLNIINISKNQGLGRKVVASLIRWQLIELGIWGIRKIVSKKK